MKKGPKIALFIFNLLSGLAAFVYSFFLFFIGLFAEALVAAFTLGHADADGAILAMFAPTSLILIFVGIVAIVGAILSFIKKRSKGLNIAGGIVMSLAALLMLIAVLVLFINIGFSGDNYKAFIVIGLIALIHIALYVLTALFGNFLLLKKKEEVVNA